MSPRDCTIAQAHPDARGRPCIGNGIHTGAAVQGVRAAVAFQDVVPVITGQCIRVLTAANLLNPPNPVSCRISAGTFTGAQVHCHARYRFRIGNGIHAFAAIQDVSAGATNEQVVTLAAIQIVITGSAYQPVISLIAI